MRREHSTGAEYDYELNSSAPHALAMSSIALGGLMQLDDSDLVRFAEERHSAGDRRRLPLVDAALSVLVQGCVVLDPLREASGHGPLAGSLRRVPASFAEPMPSSSDLSSSGSPQAVREAERDSAEEHAQHVLRTFLTSVANEITLDHGRADAHGGANGHGGMGGGGGGGGGIPRPVDVGEGEEMSLALVRLYCMLRWRPHAGAHLQRAIERLDDVDWGIVQREMGLGWEVRAHAIHRRMHACIHAWGACSAGGCVHPMVHALRVPHAPCARARGGARAPPGLSHACPWRVRAHRRATASSCCST